MARRYPARLVAGDVLSALPGVLDGFPPGRRVIVTDAYLAVFLAPPQRAELAGVLARAGLTRPVTWLSLDPLVPLGPSGRDSVQGLALPAALVRDYQRRGVFAVLGERAFDGRAGTAGCWPGPTPQVNGSNGSISVLARISRSHRCPGRPA